MKTALVSLALASLATTALAQPRPAKAPPPPPEPPAIAAALFPCRTPQEVCFVGVVRQGKLLVLFTNDPKTDEITGKPLAVAAGEGGTAPDLAAAENRLVMMTGSYDPKAGLTKAEVVDTASPLTAFAIKAALGGGEAEGPPPPPPPPGKKR